MLNRVITEYREAVFDTDRNRALEVIRAAVAAGMSPEEIVFNVVTPCLDSMVDSLTAEGTISLAQHFMASQLAAEVTEEMTAQFKQAPVVAGSVIIGTSLGDFHGLGKRIVIGCLKSLIADVTDLGVNVAPERFVEEAVARDAQVIAISSMMVHTARSEQGCLGVRRILQANRLENKIKIIVGGAAFRFDPDLYKIVEADAWAEDGVAARNQVTRLIREAKQ